MLRADSAKASAVSVGPGGRLHRVPTVDASRSVGPFEFLEGEIAVLDAEIGSRMQPYEDRIQHLITIPGVDRIVAWTILAELGPGRECISGCAACCELGRNVSWEPRECRQTDERTNAEGKSISAAGFVPGGVGSESHQGNVSRSSIPAVASTLRTHQGDLRSRPPHPDCCLPDVAER